MNLANPPSFVESGSQRFLIFDAPNETNLPIYLSEFTKHNVTAVVRVCDPTYSTTTLEAQNIKVYDWPFSDGASPPSSVIENWRTLCNEVFIDSNPDHKTIGVHCVAGLGRAPVLVAIALIESGMDNLKAIEVVRAKRRGSINTHQLKWLTEYKPSRSQCIVM